jgi:hypothetical protein
MLITDPKMALEYTIEKLITSQSKTEVKRLRRLWKTKPASARMVL